MLSTNYEIFDLLKNIPTPGSQGGPTSAPRGGKYIRRWWEGDHWEYEYANEPHANHGIEHVDNKQGHSLEVPEGLSDAKHNLAAEGNEDALSSMYEHSREQGPHMEPGHNFETVNPMTGNKMQVTLRQSGDGNTKVETNEHVTDPETGKTKKVRRIVPSWEKFSINQNALRETAGALQRMGMKDAYIRDGEGNILFEIIKAKGKGKSGSRAGYDWKMVPSSDNPLAKVKRMERRTPEEAVRDARSLVEQIGSLKASQNSPTMSDMIRQGVDPVQALESGAKLQMGKQVQSARVRSGEQLGVSYDSPQQFEEVVDAVKERHSDTIMDIGIKLDTPSVPEQIVSDAIAEVVSSYHPSSGKTLAQSIEEKITGRLKQQMYTEKMTSGKTKDGESTAVDPLRSKKQGAVQNEAADAMASQIDYTGGQETSEQGSVHFADALMGEQREHLNDFKRNPQNAEMVPLANLVENMLEEQAHKLSQSPDFEMQGHQEAVQQFFSPVFEFAKEKGVAPEVLRPFLKLPENLGKSISVDIKKAYAWALASLNLSLEIKLEKADPEYSHKEGSNLYPKYFYKDSAGNSIRYNNAPDGHDDNDNRFGESVPSQEEFSPENAPQFFSPDGRKLTRAPFTDTDVQWNPNYHREDPQNLWAGKWVNPVTGEHEYTYIDSDLREKQELKINMQNAQLDVRLPMFRQYVAALFKSQHTKDRTVAVALALLDQGRFRVRDLMSLRVGDVKVTRDLVYFGRKSVHGGPNLRQQISSMTSNRDPMQPLWMIPVVNANSEVDYSSMRRIGPHFVVNLMEELGVSPEALQTYHASQTYSMEMQRIFSTSDMSYDAAHSFALLEVAAEMGHNLDNTEDFEQAIHIIGAIMVDPVVMSTIKQSCGELGLGNGQPSAQRPVFDSVPHVSMTLSGRNEEEEAFSAWLRMAAVHNFVGQRA